jgi:ketosteroid isomerase-like protein
MKRNRFFILLLLFLLWACQTSDEEQIRQVLNQRGEAFKKKDLSLYFSCFSKDYQDKEGSLAQLQKRMESYFKTFDRIDYNTWDRSVQMDGETATVTQQFYIEVEVGGNKNSFSNKEAFLLRKEGRTWKILKGL